MPYLEKLGFNLVGYGCTTCIGNSGPLPDEISAAVNAADLAVVVGALRQPQLRGPDQPGRQDELPRLAAAGGRVRDRRHDGHRPDPRAARAPTRPATRCTCTTSGRSPQEVQAVIDSAISSEMFTKDYADVFAGDERWQLAAHPDRRDLHLGRRLDLRAQAARTSRAWPPQPAPVVDIAGARVLAKLGDSVTTDHISPAGSIKADSPAGRYLHRARRRQEGLQLVRVAPGQPRGDDPRHVRQHPAAQPAGAGRRGRLHGQPTSPASQTTIYDASRGLPGGRRAAGHPGRQGVRLRLVARLGGEGHHAARAYARSSPSRTSGSTGPT